MNPCTRFAPMLGARPGELSDADAAALADHLGACEACQARLADAEALSGMLGDALLAEASRRDFSRFSDEVLARIPAYRGSARAGRGGFFDWVRHHRLLSAAGALVPALAALALVVYVGRSQEPEEPAFQVTAEGRSTTVLETSEGPVVLFGADEPTGG